MPAADPDRELVARWAAGDRDAGEQLVRRHFDAVYRFFDGKLHGHGGGRIDDLVQETFLACAEQADRAHDIIALSFRAYLFGIAKHRLYAHYRRRPLCGDGDFDPARSSVQGMLGAKGASMTRRIAQAELAALIDTLPIDTQLLLELRYEEDLTSEELGAIFGANAATVRSRLRSARELLRERLSDSGSPPGRTAMERTLTAWAERDAVQGT